MFGYQCLGVWVSVGGCLGISGGGATGSSESSRGSDILANLVGKDGPFPNTVVKREMN